MAAITFAQQGRSNQADADLQRILALLLAQEKEAARQQDSSGGSDSTNAQKDLIEKLLNKEDPNNLGDFGESEFGNFGDGQATGQTFQGGTPIQSGGAGGEFGAGENFASIFGNTPPPAAGQAGAQSSQFGGGTGVFNAGGEQIGGGQFTAGGEAGGSGGGGGGGGLGAGGIMALILATAVAQGQGDRQEEGSIGSRFQEGALPSPAKNLGLTEGSEFNAKEFGIGTFLPFLNFFREPNTKGQEDGQVILTDLGMSGGRSGNNRNAGQGEGGKGGFLLNLFG